jgi:hypothetical protein
VGKRLNDLRLFAKYHLKRRVFDHPAPETELGLVELGYGSEEFERSLRAVADRYEVGTLQEIDYGGRPHPLFRAASRSPARGEARSTLLVLGGVHGNEHAGILAVPEILARVAEPAVRVVALAPVNPVGASELSRYNADGFDINRDFVRFETREARAVRQVFEEERPDFVVSLHEGPQDRTFMFLNRFVDLALAQRLAAAVERGGSPLASVDYFGRRLEPPGIAPMSRSVWLLTALWARALGMEATGMWCDERGVPEITLESSWRLDDRSARIRPHVDLVDALVRELAAPREPLID